MTEKKKKTLKEDDPKQSEEFRKAVAELEAAGGLNPVDLDVALEKVIKAKATKDA